MLKKVHWKFAYSQKYPEIPVHYSKSRFARWKRNAKNCLLSVAGKSENQHQNSPWLEGGWPPASCWPPCCCLPSSLRWTTSTMTVVLGLFSRMNKLMTFWCCSRAFQLWQNRRPPKRHGSSGLHGLLALPRHPSWTTRGTHSIIAIG